MGIGFVKSDLSAGNLLFLATQYSPVSGHPPYFSLVSAFGNNSRKRTALRTDTFFNSQTCPRMRALTVFVFFSMTARPIVRSKLTHQDQNKAPHDLMLKLD